MGVEGGGTKQGADGKVPVADLPKAIEEYFESCKPKYVLKDDGAVLMDGDKPVYTFNPPTINGLCRFLGYSSVAYMNNVMRHPDSPRAKVLQEAVLRIAEWHESRLADRNAQGSMFWLKSVQKDVFGDQPQTHFVAGLSSVKLSDEEAAAFKHNLSVLLGKPEVGGDIEVEE